MLNRQKDTQSHIEFLQEYIEELEEENKQLRFVCALHEAQYQKMKEKIQSAVKHLRVA